MSDPILTITGSKLMSYVMARKVKLSVAAKGWYLTLINFFVVYPTAINNYLILRYGQV
jgi:hypothetical protein